MVDLYVEPLSDKLIGEVQPLIELHYEELTLHKQVVKLDPDWNRYKSLADQKMITIITARDKGILIGYSLFFVSSHIHYKNNVMANNDVLYLHPEYRQGRTGLKLIRKCEQVLQELGVDKIIWHVKYAKDFRQILYRLGYEDEDALVGKIIRN
jgi:GNAT superfamily N-acetyltransferase